MTQLPIASEPIETAPNGSQEALQTVVRVLRVAQYRQGTVLWILAVCLMLGAAYYATAPRLYRSDAKLLVIEQGSDDITGVGDKAGSDNIIATHKELVRSPIVVTGAIERLAPEHRVDLLEVEPRDWVESLSSRLTTSHVRMTNFIGVGYESLHPEAAAAVVRAVIDSYLSFVEETHRGTAAEVLDVLTVERDRLEVDLTEKQNRLRQSREQIGHLALPDRDNVVDPIIDRALKINDALMGAQQQRIGLQASLATVRSAAQRGEDLRQHVGLVQQAVGERMMLAAMGLGESDMVALAEQQKRVLELRSKLEGMLPFYGPSHPTVQALQQQIGGTERFIATFRGGSLGKQGSMTNKELAPILESMIGQSLAQSTEREDQLEIAFQEARTKAARQSGDFVQIEMLQREVERLEKLHDVLFDKIAAVDIHKVQAPIRVNIVQEPLPDDAPSSPRLRNVLLASLLGGLMLGMLTAYVQDLADDRFGSPDEMARQLGCRVLAVVRELPALPGRGVEAIQMYVKPQATESEAFRTLRTSIALGAEVSERLLISSSEPSDGKTTVSANLAVSYALSGKRTLLIDSDLRKPGLTNLFDLKGDPGVTEILATNDDVGVAAEQRIYRTAIDNLHVIPAGPRRPDPAELLLGDQFAALLAWADGRYDQVLVDCPPVLAVSDAQIVSRLVDGVILVVTPEKNHRRLVERAYHSFVSCGANVVGVVANRISEQAGRGYGYGYGYGYGHEEDDEQPGDSIQVHREAA